MQSPNEIRTQITRQIVEALTNGTLNNFRDTAWRLKSEVDLPEGWEGEAYDWPSENKPHTVENRDDQCGCRSEEELLEAFEALDYRKVA
jgi:hypothetical protein